LSLAVLLTAVFTSSFRERCTKVTKITSWCWNVSPIESVLPWKTSLDDLCEVGVDYAFVLVMLRDPPTIVLEA
jgi:hypothetical protein